jgi:nucleoid-associated protein YgaU
MTSDAKIGLLLGLIFIFVIAFVINGLPSLRPPISKVEATPLGGEDFDGVTGKMGQAIDNWAPPEPQRTGGEATLIAGGEPKAAPQEPAPVAQGPLPFQPQPQTAPEEGVRSSYPLAGIEKLIEQFTPTVQKNHVVADTGLGVHGPALELPAAGGRQNVAVAAPPARSEPVLDPKLIETLTKTETREMPRSADVADRLKNIPSGRVYTVVEGDNLGSIAKKVYGLDEGNRMVNIKRIVQANQAVLPSPDAVRVGQKLIIPPLPATSTTTKAAVAPAVSTNRPMDVLPQKLFEKVEALGRRAPAPAPAPAAEGRWYTVQNGDSLWKIAASQLGSGTRCDEIAKLNVETLNSSDTLDVGMKLRLPPK